MHLTDFAPYEAVTQSHAGQFMRPDFALLRSLDASYTGATAQEHDILDLTHREALVATAKAWQELFAHHPSPSAASFVSEIASALASQRVTPQWMTYLPLRFAASISSHASLEERALYDDESSEGRPIYTALLENWHSHAKFKQALDKIEVLRDIRFFAPRHIPENRVLLPVLGKDELCLHDLLFMNLYTIAPISIPLQTIEGRLHGLSNPTPLGFALHDILHALSTVHFTIGTPAQIPADIPQELIIEDAPRQDFLEASHQKVGVLLDASKYLVHKSLEQGFESQAFRQTVFTLFAAHHERPRWTPDILAALTLDDSIKAMADHLRGFDDDVFDTLNFHVTPSEEGKDHDLFHTSVLDGSSALTDAEIAAAYAEVDLTPKPVLPMSFKFDATQAPFKRTPNRIQVTATYVGDETHVNPLTQEVSYLNQFSSRTDVQTLYYRIKDFEGTRSMLDYVTPHTLPAPVTLETLLQGRGASSFTQEEAKDASRNALAYLHTLAREASRVMAEFTVTAKTLLSLPEAKSLHTRHYEAMARLAALFRQKD